VADPTVLEVYRREVTPELYRDVRELYKRHSLAEDARDLEGLISTLTPDCVYELVQTGHRWEGHDGARRFYTELLTAFPDIRFDLTDIVIGPQGVCEEANVAATQQGPWLGTPPAEVEGPDLVPVGSRAAPLPRREGLRQRDRPAASVLGHEELLAGDDRRGREVVPLLELPHTLAWVTRIHLLGHGPERVARTHDIRALRPCPVRAAGSEADGERQGAKQDEELAEHLFAS